MSTDVNLNNRELAILERCWLAETCDQLPAQVGTSNVVKQLEVDGYIEPMALVPPGLFSVTVKGHRLTKLGRLRVTISPT